VRDLLICFSTVRASALLRLHDGRGKTTVVNSVFTILGAGRSDPLWCAYLTGCQTAHGVHPLEPFRWHHAESSLKNLKRSVRFCTP
jgi:hypothetical protein